jgi:hypothetical protein
MPHWKSVESPRKRGRPLTYEEKWMVYYAFESFERNKAEGSVIVIEDPGSDHGAGHPLLILCPAKEPNCRKYKALKEFDHYSKWPKVADAVIEAKILMP